MNRTWRYYCDECGMKCTSLQQLGNNRPCAQFIQPKCHGMLMPTPETSRMEPEQAQKPGAISGAEVPFAAQQNLASNLTKSADSVAAILDERGNRYGCFADNARIAAQLKHIIATANDNRIKRGQPPLRPHQQEAIHQICSKLSRILSGDCDYQDNWVDIAGYAQLAINPR